MLRFVAACMVVVTHTTFYVGSRIDPGVPLWNTGAQGVNLFFVISGFVMFLASRPLSGRPDAFRYFMLSRIIRIVPLYWMLNLLKIAQILIIPSLAFANPTVSNIVLSLLFIPSRNADGAIETFYGVGWTLNFEMAFYLIFGLALLWRLRIVPVVALVLLIAAALSIVRTDGWPAATYIFHPIVLNFLWGMLIGAWSLRGGMLPPAVACAMIAVGALVIFGWPDISLLELEYAAVVAGFVALEPRLAGRLPHWVLFGGDASYSLYLVHPMVGALMALVLARHGVHDPLLAFAVIVSACLATAGLAYRSIEMPITETLRARFLRRAASAPGRGTALTVWGRGR